jgi:hypothetical protein
LVRASALKVSYAPIALESLVSRHPQPGSACPALHAASACAGSEKVTNANPRGRPVILSILVVEPGEIDRHVTESGT